jgi:hypothetical protein
MNALTRRGLQFDERRTSLAALLDLDQERARGGFNCSNLESDADERGRASRRSGRIGMPSRQHLGKQHSATSRIDNSTHAPAFLQGHKP